MRNRLLQLLADNRRQYVPMPERIVTAAAQDGSREATIYLYDAIVPDRATAEWWGGVCPQDFVPAVRALDVDTLHLRINSPGGDVFGSEAMCQALRDTRAHVVAHIEGLAASAATSVACAADEVIISAGSKYMIHQAWCLALGNADDLRATAELLDKCDADMIADYVRRSGNDTARVTEWVKAETWFNAQEAIDAGFADSLAVSDKADSKKARAGTWNLRAYGHAPVPDAFNPEPEPKPEPTAADLARELSQREHQQRRARLLVAPRIV